MLELKVYRDFRERCDTRIEYFLERLKEILILFWKINYQTFLLISVAMNDWMNSTKCVLFSCGAAAQHGPRPLYSWKLQITHNVAPQSVGFLCTSDQLVTETSTWQHTTLTDELTVLRIINMHVNLTNAEMLQNLLMVMYFGLSLYACNFSPLGLSARVCSQIQMDYPLRRFTFYLWL